MKRITILSTIFAVVFFIFCYSGAAFGIDPQQVQPQRSQKAPMKGSTKMIKKLYKQMQKTGTTDYRMPKTEVDLFRNPRMMRR